MSLKTAIISLSETPETTDEKELLEEKNLPSTIVDLSVSEETRLKALDLYYDSHGFNDTIEIINKLAGLFQFSGLSLLKSYLYNICVVSTISPVLKTIIVKSLCSYKKDDETGYKAINIIYPSMGNDVPIPCKVEIVILLMHHKNYKKQATTYFCDIINDSKIDCNFRYKTILKLEHSDVKNKDYFISEACWEFINHDNPTLYKILAGQYLLQKCKKLTDKRKNKIETILLSFAQDNDLDYNLRADASDVILQLGEPKHKEIAKDIIILLGRNGHLTRTVYENAQNVHSEEIDKSTLEIIEFLATIPTTTLKSQEDIEEEKKTGKTVRGNEIDFNYVKSKILKIIELEKKQKNISLSEKYDREETIKISLDRIYMDRALYTSYNCTLTSILIKVWSYISGHDSETEMIKRLLDELVEMAGTCSSGFASRLVNSITGFGDFSLRISWRDQIISNLGGRLNARARNIDDIDFQEKVLCEMAIKSEDYESRKNFLRFFRQNLLSIRDEMYEEFRHYIDDATFDLSFRAAIAVYEIGSYV